MAGYDQTLSLQILHNQSRDHPFMLLLMTSIGRAGAHAGSIRVLTGCTNNSNLTDANAMRGNIIAALSVIRKSRVFVVYLNSVGSKRW